MTHAKDFFREKIGPNSPDFFLGLKQVAKNIEGFVIHFYFDMWFIAKFGQTFLWMIANLATWGKGKKGKKKTTDLNCNKENPETEIMCRVRPWQLLA